MWEDEKYLSSWHKETENTSYKISTSRPKGFLYSFQLFAWRVVLLIYMYMYVMYWDGKPSYEDKS